MEISGTCRTLRIGSAPAYPGLMEIRMGTGSHQDWKLLFVRIWLITKLLCSFSLSLSASVSPPPFPFSLPPSLFLFFSPHICSILLSILVFLPLVALAYTWPTKVLALSLPWPSNSTPTIISLIISISSYKLVLDTSSQGVHIHTSQTKTAFSRRKLKRIHPKDS